MVEHFRKKFDNHRTTIFSQPVAIGAQRTLPFRDFLSVLHTSEQAMAELADRCL